MGMASILDQKTVITAEKVMPPPILERNALLVLAGSLSPWWGRESQVRRVHDIIFSNYEITLLTVTHPWVFNRIIAPIHLPSQFHAVHTPIYGKDVIIYGIEIDEYQQLGGVVSKGTYFNPSLNTAVHEHWRACEQLYLDLKIKFDKLVHYCIYPNDTFYHGALGSPAIGINKLGEIKLVGVIIRTSPDPGNRMSLIVKTSYLDQWIKVNSLLGNKMVLPG